MQTSPRPTWKVLHIRSTAGETFASSSLNFPSAGARTLSKLATASLESASRDFARLANWAFSFDGLRNLQILAFGGFSLGERYAARISFSAGITIGTYRCTKGMSFSGRLLTVIWICRQHSISANGGHRLSTMWC